MKRLSVWSGLVLVFDIALLIVCLLHVPSILQRPRAPFDVVSEHDRIRVDKILVPDACPDIRKGDELLTWRDRSLPIPEMVSFLADHSTIGDQIPVTYRRADRIYRASITLVNSQTISFVIIIFIVGLVTWCVGLFVILNRPNDLTAGLLHWSMIAMAVIVMMELGRIPPESGWRYVSRTLFLVSYVTVAGTFLFFTAMFPRPKPGSAWMKAMLILTPMYVLAGAMVYYHVRAIHDQSVADYASYHVVFNIFRIALVLYVIAGVLNFIHSYITAVSSEERKKLKWILWGLCIGPMPFLFLSTLPQILLSRDLVSDQYTLPFLLVIPVAFGISFIKYHILDIEFVINRTAVYSIVLGGLLAVYALLITTVAAFIGTVTASAAAALVVV
jgi:hypothetical protein